MKLQTATRRAIRQVDLDPRDVAAAELALEYARQIDAAHQVRASLVKVLREVEELDVDVHDRLLPLATRIEQVHVVGLLGPKLLGALVELGLSPRTRASLMRGAQRGSRRSPLDEIRARRAARQHDTAPVDPAPS